MGNLKPNISRHEVSCRCGCGFDTLDLKTAEVIQEVCDHIADSQGIDRVILDISSGCRCPEWNEHEGGGEDSQHLYGRAIDFSIRGVDPALVYIYLDTR